MLWTSKLAIKLNLAIFKEQVALLGFTYVNVFEDMLIFEMYFIMPSLSLIRDSLLLVGFNFSSSYEQQPIWTDLRIGWAGLRRRLNYIWWRYNQLLLLFCCPSSSNVTCRPLLLVMDVSTALNVSIHGTLSHLYQLNSPKVHLTDDISWFDLYLLTASYFEREEIWFLLTC